MNRKSTLSVAFALSFFIFAPIAAQAATGSISSGIAGQVPYYATNGTTLSPTSNITILQNGHVGIGTTSPFQTLSVHGPTFLSGSLTLNGPNIASLTVNNSSWLVDQSAFNVGFTDIATNLNSISSQSVLNIQGRVPSPTNSNSNYEKAGLLIETMSSDPSTYGSGGITRDIVGLDARGEITSNNRLGRAWGLYGEADALSGGDGLLDAMELTVNNQGSDQASVGTPTSKYGAHIIAGGTASATAAIWIDHISPTLWHEGLFADPSTFGTSPGDNFIDLNNAFVVKPTGYVGIGTSSPMAPLTVMGNILLPNSVAYEGMDANGSAKPILTIKNDNFVHVGDGSRSIYLDTGTNFNTIVQGGLGIGTPTPSARLEVVGSDQSATTAALLVLNGASATTFAVYDNGNATYEGSIYQSSDERLKTNVTPLDASSALTAIEGLTPVSYNRIDQPGTGTNFGFIAQAVQKIFPNLVSSTSPTTLTPGGTLTLNYVGLIAPIVESIQALASEIKGFGQSITTVVLNATTGNFTRVNTQDLCIGDTCVTEAQLKAMLQASGQQGSASQNR